MAVNYDIGQVPKGASNSNALAQTPGTQATAMQNVGTGANINTNMPVGPQLAKQTASSFQQGLMKAPMPRPATGSAIRQARQRPVVSRGLPMDQGRGYNIFSGMDAGQISGMNQSMGLSNMTSLPSPAPSSDGGAGFGLKPGRQQQQFLTSMVVPQDEGSTEEGSTEEGSSGSEKPKTIQAGGQTLVYNEETGLYQNEFGNITYDPETGEVKTSFGYGAPTYTIQSKTLDEFQAEQEKYSQKTSAVTTEETTEEIEDDGYTMPTYEEVLADIYSSNENEYQGFDPEKKQQAEEALDQKYASLLDQLLAGVDRQAAMMGTFGSGAHSTSINNAIATGLAQMANEYANLGLADMQQAEIDINEKVQNKMAIASMLKELELLTDENADFAERFNIASTMSSSLVTDAQGFNDTFGDPSFTPVLNEIERKLTDALLGADPSEYQGIQNQYESYITEYMAFVNEYRRVAREVANSDFSQEAKTNRSREITNNFLAPLLMKLGLVNTMSVYGNGDYPQYQVNF